MELRQLECFVAVVEESSFTRAAARLHIVQSAVPATIASLERELETPLLLRTTRQIRLTDAGQQLLPKARATLEAARDAREAVHEVTGGIRGTLRIDHELTRSDRPARFGGTVPPRAPRSVRPARNCR
ncbi:LysR family transcriptional regulator [Amycolatopsis sp. NBC_00345]|uniref:LysR family transcriptional regulator n=1 Tax=Amycolatopsis sp. NBC_00345 TaxID=2975955 RepID=UPI002E276DD6